MFCYCWLVVELCLVIGDQSDIRRIMSAFDGDKLAIVVAMVWREIHHLYNLTVGHREDVSYQGPTKNHMIIDTGGPR
jgi:hypothetical protein